MSLSAPFLAAQGSPTTPVERVLTRIRPAPRLNGALFGAFGRDPRVQVSSGGDLTFGASSTFGGVTPQWALLMGRNIDDVILVIREGTEPSGALPQVTVGDGSLGLEVRGGRVAILVPLEGAVQPSVDDRAIYAGAPGGMNLVVRLGDVVPGGAAITSLGAPRYDSGGSVAYLVGLAGGDVNGTTNDSAIMLGARGSQSFLIRGGDSVNSGQQAVGTISGGVFRSDGSMLLEMTLSTSLGQAPASSSEDWALGVRDPSGNVSTVLREGDAVLPGGASVDDSFRIVDVHPEGSFLVAGKVANVDYLLLYDSSLALRRVLSPSTPLPGLGGVSIATVQRAFLADEAILVQGKVLGPGIGVLNDGVILSVSRTTGVSTILAQEGDAAPFAPPNMRFQEFNTNNAFGLVGNARGQFLMSTWLASGATSAIVLYGFDPQRGFFLLSSLPGTPLLYRIYDYDINDSGDVAINTEGRPPGDDTVFRTHLGSFFGVPSSIDATAGGGHTMDVVADSSLAGLPYFIAGSTSGTWPGIQVTPSIRIPLNPDPWTSASFGAINNVFSANLGVLDSNGLAQSRLTVPTGVPQFAGTVFHHAYAVVEANGTVRFISEPVSLRLF